MSDLIDRQAAIDAIARATFDVTISGRQGFYYYKDEFKKAFVAIRDKYIEALKALPPAEPERKKGEWLGGELGNFTLLVGKDGKPLIYEGGK